MLVTCERSVWYEATDFNISLCWPLSPQASVWRTWRSSFSSLRPPRPCWPDSWKLSRGKVRLPWQPAFPLTSQLTLLIGDQFGRTTRGDVSVLLLTGADNPTLYRTFTAGGGLEVRQYYDCGKNVFILFCFFHSPISSSLCVCEPCNVPVSKTRPVHTQRKFQKIKGVLCLRTHDVSDSKSSRFSHKPSRCVSDPPAAELDQLDLPALCDGLRRYLQDLPQPVVPAALHAQMVHAVKGESRPNVAFIRCADGLEAWRVKRWRDVPKPYSTFCEMEKTTTHKQLIRSPLLLLGSWLHQLKTCKVQIMHASALLFFFNFEWTFLLFFAKQREEEKRRKVAPHCVLLHCVLLHCILLLSHGQKQDICG